MNDQQQNPYGAPGGMPPQGQPQGQGGYPPPPQGYPQSGYPPPPPGYPPYGYPQPYGDPQGGMPPQGQPQGQGGQPQGQGGYPPPPQGYPQGGYPPPPPGYPPYGYPYGGYPGYPPYPPPPPPKSDNPIGEFGRQGDFRTIIKLPENSLNIDEGKFLRLLAGSVSLLKDEKKKIIEAVPKLTQQQIDDLMRILEEEISKFKELDMAHKDELQKLEAKASQEWAELEGELTATERQAAEEDQAAKLREQLKGGGSTPPAA